jgi:hypothetical protein
VSNTAIIATVDDFKRKLDHIRKANPPDSVDVDCSTNNATVFLHINVWDKVAYKRAHMEHLFCDSPQEAQLIASLLQITFCA